MSELPEHNDHEVEPVDAADTAEDDASPAEVFEHLARIRSGISDGVITPW